MKDVVPALRMNSDGLKKVLDDLLKQYKSKQDEMEKWKVRHARSRHVYTEFVDSGLAILHAQWLTLIKMQKKNNIQVVQQ